MKRFRLYYDKDLEEAWLQEMDAAGWAFNPFALGYIPLFPVKRGNTPIGWSSGIRMRRPRPITRPCCRRAAWRW